MANGSYGYRAKQEPVDYNNGLGPMRQVEVYRGKVGQGTPLSILVPVADYDAIDGIKGEFVAAKKPPPTIDAKTLPPPPLPPPPSTEPTTVRPSVPMIQSQPGVPNQPQKPRAFQFPPRVPIEQMPPEQRQLYPELNQ
jgi:hypothetical protein